MGGLPLPQPSENIFHRPLRQWQGWHVLERDKAKDLLKEGKDPSTEKQLDKHRPIQVAEWIVAVAFDISIIADLLIDTAHAVAGFSFPSAS